MNTKNNAQNHHAVFNVIELHIDSFIAGLKLVGYAAKTLLKKHAALRKFANWRRRLKRPRSEPHEAEVAEFMASSCQPAKADRYLASTALLGFLEHLRHHGVITPFAPTAPDTAALRLERRYADFLRNEKGLAESSIRFYARLVANLLDYLHKERGTTAVRRLDATIVRRFLFELGRDRSSEYVRLLAISLRSFLRFLHVRDEIRNDLTAAVPTVRKWSQPGVPKKLTSAEVNRVLDAPDRKTAIGSRDYAILLLLARLGLRACEVLLLQLGDIRWRTGEILIRGKGARSDVLPLPCEVGAAIARYLRLDRGVWPTQQIFLRTNAPRVPLSGSASIGHIVRRSMVRAGVERPKHIAAHLFRHTLASRMLQQGATLRDISEVLRHRIHRSTEIYAKIDMDSLNEVVRPWPARGGAQ